MQPTKQKPIRVLLIDDHIILRAGLRLLVEKQTNAAVIGEARDRSEALEIAASEQPDIVLLNLDLRSESGLELIPQLLAAMKHGRVIALTGLRDSGEQARAIQLGASGLVLKDDEVSHLINAIERVHQGEFWFEPSVSSKLLGRIAIIAENIGKTNPESVKGSVLTKRELEIIALVSEGMKNKQIADRLFISEGTVRNHLTVIFDKLNISDRFELIIYALRHKLVTPPK
jgi:DNA-binding NarL/FixJ family response regulator